jgi:hypothetical protein
MDHSVKAGKGRMTVKRQRQQEIETESSGRGRTSASDGVAKKFVDRPLLPL